MKHRCMTLLLAAALTCSLCGCSGGLPSMPGMEHSAAKNRVDVSEIPGAEAMAQMLDAEAGQVQNVLLEHGYTELVDAWGEPDAMKTVQGTVDATQAVWVFVSDDLGGARVVEVLCDTAQKEEVQQAAVAVFQDGAALTGEIYENFKASGILEETKANIQAAVAKYYTEENKEKCAAFFSETKDVVIATAQKIDWADLAGKASDGIEKVSGWLSDALDRVAD